MVRSWRQTYGVEPEVRSVVPTLEVSAVSGRLRNPRGRGRQAPLGHRGHPDHRDHPDHRGHPDHPDHPDHRGRQV